MPTIAGAVAISIDASTVEHLESFVTMCKLAGVPGDTKVLARTVPRRQLRQLEVKADSVAQLSPPSELDDAATEE
jgi:hypothetical protein